MTCGGDKEVITYLCLADEDLEPVQEFDIVTDHVSAMVCYRNQEGEEVVAMAMDNNTVQAFSIAHVRVHEKCIMCAEACHTQYVG